METRYYILTRFNLALWTKDKNQAATTTDTWLDDRFRLFETYCLPSVVNQTEQNFVWFVLFDSETPDTYKERARTWEKQCPQMRIVPVMKELAWKFVTVFRKLITDDLVDSSCRVATTYLDNDDALGCNYMSRVRLLAESAAPNTFISFRHGLQYYEDNHYVVELDYPNNHFLSFVEDVDANHPLRTVMGYGSHAFVAKIKETSILYDTEKPQWLEVVHSRNVINDVLMSPHFKLSSNKSALQDFSLSVPVCTKRIRNYCHHYPRVLRQILLHAKWRLFGGGPFGKRQSL